MVNIIDLEKKKKEIRHQLAGVKRVNERLYKTFMEKSDTQRNVARKYRDRYEAKRVQARSEIKEINRTIKKLRKESRKRCPNGTRKNRKTMRCEKQ